MPPVPLAYILSQPHVFKDDASKHNGIAAHHPAAQEKLLERWLWIKESMESATAKEVKPPDPVNHPHPMAKTTSLPRRANGNGCSLNGSHSTNSSCSFRSSAQLQTRLTQRHQYGHPQSSHALTTAGLALPAAPGQAQPQMRHRFLKSLRANPLSNPTLLHGREEATS